MPSRSLAALAALAAVATSALHSAEPAAASGCGTLADRGARVHVRVLAGPVRCRAPRVPLRHYRHSNRPCAGSSCLRHGGRWTCQTAAVYAFPRLASCQRRSSRIAAYSTAH